MFITKVRYIEHFLKYKFPVSEYMIVNSVWLTLMDIRINGDLDILMSNKLWNKEFNSKPKHLSFGIPGEHEKKIRVHSIHNGSYLKLDCVKSNDDLIFNHKVLIDGIPIITPKIYFLYKMVRFKEYNAHVKRLSWMERLYPIKEIHKKYIAKRNKDRNDFKSIKKFFLEKKHLSPFWENKNIDWGINNENLRKFVLEYKF